ncbi:MAG: 4-demethylwyosine synthase TYW1 [Methanomassiliicoccales archaeon]|jgi:tRNA wybutosine-synthesizing protein 1
MDEELRQRLSRQQYHIVGNHSAVKLCHWMRESILKGRMCYKQAFYGIKSHRCLQMTPVVNDCTHSCTFCWRITGFEGGLQDWDEPREMMDELVRQQRLMVTGFPGDPRCDRTKYEEARDPKHVAISLAGEPTLYPRLGDLIAECHRRGMSTFLVSNGTVPGILAELDPLPTQLYITVAAPNKDVYRSVCQPRIADGWEKIMGTLELLPSLGTRTVIRHTLVDGQNLGWVDEYAELDGVADPTFIEPKGFVFVGSSRLRMTIANMPSHQKVKEFGMSLADRLGLGLLNEKADSRVVLLGEQGARTELDLE